MLWKLKVVVCVAVLGLVSSVYAQSGPSNWPAQVSTAGGAVTIFQPQLDDFQGDQLSSRAAVSVQLNGQTDPVFGAVWFHDQVAVDNSARTVRILQVSIANMRFPNSDPAVQQAVQDAVGQYFFSRQVVLNLDQLNSTLDVLHKEQTASAAVQADAPKIIFRDHPAVKVQYDGAPRLVQVDNSNLMRVINTPFFVVLDPPSRTYFLKGGGRWFAAPDPLGPFQQTPQAPPAVSALADSSGYQDPQQPLNVDPNANVEIVTATEPTELIWTSGQAQMGTIANTDLLYVANTDADLFLTIDHPQYFVLLSGRWYTAPTESGPWAFVPPGQLPDDFKRIPPGSEKGGVLVSVPGTQSATDAVADSYVPQTAAVDTQQFDQPPVTYDGDPNFQPIDGCPVTYAVNTGASVVCVGGHYYCCYNAVWYDSAAAVGPWGICAAVPGVIYTIPPSCPVYPVRFVYIYGRGPNAIYFGYLPGYVGSYVYDGVVVYGTGFRYAPWIGHDYFGRPYTYGFAAHYDWYTGRWGFDFGIALGGGFDWVAHGPGDHWHDAWFGYGGFHPVYARDEAHLVVAAKLFEADRGRHEPVLSVYDRRGDLRADLAGGRPRPLAVEHSEVFAHGGPNLPPRADVRPEDLHRDDAGHADAGRDDRGKGAPDVTPGGGKGPDLRGSDKPADNVTPRDQRSGDDNRGSSDARGSGGANTGGSNNGGSNDRGGGRDDRRSDQPGSAAPAPSASPAPSSGSAANGSPGSGGGKEQDRGNGGGSSGGSAGVGGGSSGGGTDRGSASGGVGGGGGYQPPSGPDNPGGGRGR